MFYVYSQVVCAILISLLFNNSRIQAQNGNVTDRLSLLAFKKSIVQDPQNALASWNDSLHFCQWEGVTCGRRHQRVTRIDFTSTALSGPLSPYVANLSFLQVLQINDNSLYGEIPPQLGNLFRLKALNLFLNNLGGVVPTNISRCSNLQHLRVGRNNLVGKLPEQLGALSKLKSLVIEENSFTGRIPPFLHKATSGFSLENLVGNGGFGCVYKGVLDADRMSTVAVKVLNLHTRESYKSFMNECETLRNTRHRNLVKIITTCSSVDFQGNDFRALVYEFMPNGSLEQWLYSSLKLQKERRLNLVQKLNIAIDVSYAVDYLHNQCENPIIHCDLKPSNILLDDDMVAHVGDFGLAKIIHPEITEVTQSSSVGLKGTIGYAAPEYGLGSEISKSGDVYSFGILLLEMITGKRPTDAMFNEGLNLHKFVGISLRDHVKGIISPSTFHGDFEETVETTKESGNGTTIGENVVGECLLSALKVGIACSVESPQARMSIADVVFELNSIRDTLASY